MLKQESSTPKKGLLRGPGRLRSELEKETQYEVQESEGGYLGEKPRENPRGTKEIQLGGSALITERGKKALTPGSQSWAGPKPGRPAFGEKGAVKGDWWGIVVVRPGPL